MNMCFILINVKTLSSDIVEKSGIFRSEHWPCNYCSLWLAWPTIKKLLRARIINQNNTGTQTFQSALFLLILLNFIASSHSGSVETMARRSQGQIVGVVVLYCAVVWRDSIWR